MCNKFIASISLVQTRYMIYRFAIRPAASHGCPARIPRAILAFTGLPSDKSSRQRLSSFLSTIIAFRCARDNYISWRDFLVFTSHPNSGQNGNFVCIRATFSGT